MVVFRQKGVITIKYILNEEEYQEYQMLKEEAKEDNPEEDNNLYCVEVIGNVYGESRTSERSRQ